MSCLYVLWDVIGASFFFGLEMGWQWSLIIIGGVTPTDDTIARKVNTSDASAFAKICGCFPSQGTLIIALFLPAWHVLTAERFFSKCGASSGSSSRSSFSFWASWSASSRSRYATIQNTLCFYCLFTLLIVACDLLCSNRRLSKRRMRSTFCPCQDLRAARLHCHCRPRLRCSSALCRPHCSLCYD